MRENMVGWAPDSGCAQLTFIYASGSIKKDVTLRETVGIPVRLRAAVWSS